MQSAWLGPPCFREESGLCPLVYGYIRSRERRPSYVLACRRVLTRYCAQENLLLCAVFVDQEQCGTDVDGAGRPGLTGLCDVLELPDSFAAVMVDLRHLSPEPDVAHRLSQRLRETGARMLTVRDALPLYATASNGSAYSAPRWWQ
jgi:hypothetical protein